MSFTALGIVLGLLMGLRHAFEPDHLSAVSTLIGETDRPRHGAWLGAWWGLGHTISLLVVGVVLTLLGATLPPRAAVGFELVVSAMLLLLGARAIVRATRGGAHHVHTHERASVGRARLRPLAIGLVHGLAGSGALTALVFAQLPGTAARMFYISLFGIGSIAGMTLASGVAGTALQLVRSGRVRRVLNMTSGVVSITVGVIWAILLLA
ncbi:MAG: hypothetical protein IPQ07_40570 [Myxococcales bacterium]|nr:hypothetical protein [Myxococcales bacterium]